MVRVPPAGLRAPRLLTLLVLLAAAACAGDGPRRGGTAGGAAADPESRAPWETYVRNPTEIRAREVTALFPARWEDDLEVSGLSSGFTENEAGWRTWKGTGDCRLSLFALKIRANRLTVTLVPGEGEPEVILQAEGNVILAHVSRGIGNLSDEIEFLHIRNDKRLEH